MQVVYLSLVEPKHKMYLNPASIKSFMRLESFIVEPKHKMYLNQCLAGIGRIGLLVEPKHKMYLNADSY